jgi:hypothetical protein
MRKPDPLPEGQETYDARFRRSRQSEGSTTILLPN